MENERYCPPRNLAGDYSRVLFRRYFNLCNSPCLPVACQMTDIITRLEAQVAELEKWRGLARQFEHRMNIAFSGMDEDGVSALSRADAAEAENAQLRKAILNYWGTCNPPMNEAQKRCEDALLDALSEHEKK